MTDEEREADKVCLCIRDRHRQWTETGARDRDKRDRHGVCALARVYEDVKMYRHRYRYTYKDIQIYRYIDMGVDYISITV